MTHRQEIDADAAHVERSPATRHRTDVNRFEVPCGVCGQAFFVDEATSERVRERLGYDPSDNPFCCDDCEGEYADEEHGH